MRPIHRLLLTLNRIDPAAVLNDGAPSSGGPAPDAAEMLACLRGLIAEATQVDGRVDYGRLRDSHGYQRFRSESARLRAFDPHDLSRRPDRLAFWINLYNAMVIDAVARWEVTTTVRQVPGFFWRAAYDVGGRRYSANDIEHGILRANGVYPLIPGRHFGRRDPRLDHAVTPLEPRVHFALVCASRSCPPIRAYEAERLDDQLDLAASTFIGATTTIDAEARRVHLSRIFLWYAGDFGGGFLGFGDRRALRAEAARLARPAHPEIAAALEDDRFRLRFDAYDWSLNGVDPQPAAASTRIRASNSSRQSVHNER